MAGTTRSGAFFFTTVLAILVGFGTGVSSASANIGLVQHASKDAGTTASGSLAFSANNVAGDWIAVVVRVGASGSTFAINVADSNGNTYHNAAQFASSPIGTLAIFYAESIKAGPNTVTVTDNFSWATMRFAIFEYSGVSGASSLDLTAGMQGTGTAPNSGTITTTANGDLLLGAVMTTNAASYTGGNGYAVEESVPAEPSTKLMVEDQILPAAGTASASATLAASDHWGIVLAAFKPAAGGSPPPAPVISSLNPATGTIGTAVTISGTNFGTTVGTVTFNGTTASTTGWTATSIATSVPTGATTGSVVVTAGGVASNGVAFTVDTTPPTVTVTAPANGSTVSGTITLTATATDPDSAVSFVQFQVDGANTGGQLTSAPYTLSLDTTKLSNASHQLTAIAKDPAGNQGTSAAVTITVNNVAPPTIASLSPAFGTVGTAVTITGTNFGTTVGTVTFNGTTASTTGWTATSIATSVPTGATTGSVVVTAGGVASSGVLFTVNTSTVALPIKASANNRYFVDQSGAPWIMVADSAHAAICHVPQSSWAAYFQNRQAQGFNTVDLFAANARGLCSTSGAAQDGTLPFTSGTGPSSYDLATPNPAFWSEVDTFITEAGSHGLVVSIDPLPWGDGFSVTYQSNGPTKTFNFGAYLGSRYKNFPNIIWHLGQDFAKTNSLPSSTDLNLMAQFMAGIASADPNHLINCQLNFPRSYSTLVNSANATYAKYLTSNFVYTLMETYDEVLAAYNSSPALPVFLGESNYETENITHVLTSPANAFITRQEMWYAMTSGAAGHVFGNGHVNHFDPSYPSNLNTAATAEVKYLTSLFAQYPWWTFAPDQTHVLVTAGYGTYNGGNSNMYNATYAPTTWDGAAYSVTYTPVATTLLVDLGMFKNSVNASWYDPTTGTSTVISGSPFANSGSQSFTTPSTAHADGTQDWVLVLHP